MAANAMSPREVPGANIMIDWIHKLFGGQTAYQPPRDKRITSSEVFQAEMILQRRASERAVAEIQSRRRAKPPNMVEELYMPRELRRDT